MSQSGGLSHLVRDTIIAGKSEKEPILYLLGSVSQSLKKLWYFQCRKLLTLKDEERSLLLTSLGVLARFLGNIETTERKGGVVE